MCEAPRELRCKLRTEKATVVIDYTRLEREGTMCCATDKPGALLAKQLDPLWVSAWWQANNSKRVCTATRGLLSGASSCVGVTPKRQVPLGFVMT